MNRDQIIKRAARMINAIDSTATPDAQTISDFSEALNALVKRWQAMGIRVWAQQEATLFLQLNQNAYSIGTSSTDHCTASYIATTTTANIAIVSTTVPVASTTGMTVGDNIGIVLDHGGYQWTTIAALPGGNNITILAALTDSVTAGNAVYTYTSNLIRPLRIINCRRFVFSGSVSTPMSPMMSRQDYRNLPLLTNTGPVTQAFYDPQLVLGVLNLWPSPPDVSACVKFTGMRQLQDFNTAADTPDFPSEWIDCLTFNLALSMSPEYGVPMEQYNMIKELALGFLDTATTWDKEPESIYFGVNLSNRGS